MKTNEKALSLPKLRRGQTKKQNSKLVLLCTLMIFFMNVLVTNPAKAQPSGASLSFGSSIGATAPCTFVIEVTDTTILAIEVGLGSNRNQTDLLLHEFAFDATTGLPTGMTYSRAGNKVSIGIGDQPVLDYYFGQVRVKESSTVWSDPYKFLQN